MKPHLLIAKAHEYCIKQAVNVPEHVIRFLLEHVKKDTDGNTLKDEQVDTFFSSLDRYIQGEPLQLITGTAAFRFLELECAADVFIPRPETEWMIDDVNSYINMHQDKELKVIDLCSGTGAIALSIAQENPQVKVWGVELSYSAYQVCEKNNENYGEPVHFVHADALTALDEMKGMCDIVISNPPYVPGDDEVESYALRDPSVALWGGGCSGLDMPHALIRRAHELLCPGGMLVMEHAPSQASDLVAYARDCGFSGVSSRDDATGRKRWIRAYKNGDSLAPHIHVKSCVIQKPRTMSFAKPWEKADAIRSAAYAVMQGKLIVIPTDTVYGIACDATNAQAHKNLIATKNRGDDKPAPLLVSSVKMMEKIAVLDERAYKLIGAYMPGALTLVMPARSSWKNAHNSTVALRIPDDECVRELLAVTGPLAVSSANMTGQPPACTVDEAYAYFGDKVSVYLDGGEMRNANPSTIVSLVEDVRIVREGAISKDDVFRALQ
ncbi:MAG: peptide chain release factor N(5)-glutamine methyltransferase [Actinomycetaceae bacterium]|nr:peptide chain release factor N(5)-glutamine methyltransferase [Actinomycetaceae bacterium]